MKTLTTDQVISLKKNDRLIELVLNRIDVTNQRNKHEFSKAFYICEKMGQDNTTSEWLAAQELKEKSDRFDAFSKNYYALLRNKSSKLNLQTRGELSVCFNNFEYAKEVEGLMADELSDFVVLANYEWVEGEESKSENILDRIIRQAEFAFHLKPEEYQAPE